MGTTGLTVVQAEPAGKDPGSPVTVLGHLPEFGCRSSKVDSQVTFEQELLGELPFPVAPRSMRSTAWTDLRDSQLHRHTIAFEK
jgi:hypothetical protein